jgi:hypothetical protein
LSSKTDFGNAKSSTRGLPRSQAGDIGALTRFGLIDEYKNILGQQSKANCPHLTKAASLPIALEFAVSQNCDPINI